MGMHGVISNMTANGHFQKNEDFQTSLRHYCVRCRLFEFTQFTTTYLYFSFALVHRRLFDLVKERRLSYVHDSTLLHVHVRLICVPCSEVMLRNLCENHEFLPRFFLQSWKLEAAIYASCDTLECRCRSEYRRSDCGLEFPLTRTSGQWTNSRIINSVSY